MILQEGGATCPQMVRCRCTRCWECGNSQSPSPSSGVMLLFSQEEAWELEGAASSPWHRDYQSSSRSSMPQCSCCRSSATELGGREEIKERTASSVRLS